MPHTLRATVRARAAVPTTAMHTHGSYSHRTRMHVESRAPRVPTAAHMHDEQSRTRGTREQRLRGDSMYMLPVVSEALNGAEWARVGGLGAAAHLLDASMGPRPLPTTAQRAEAGGGAPDGPGLK